MPKVILIGGQLATGKTTLAKNLSKELAVPFFYKDIIKEKLCDKIGFKNREENLKMSAATFEILYHISEQFILLEKDLILESNFRQEELDRLCSLFDKNNYQIISIELVGNLNILYQRYLDRFKYENRNIAHANFNTKEEFLEYNQSMLDRKYPGKHIKLDASKFVDTNNVIKLFNNL